MTTLTDAISCPLCSLRRRVRITHLMRKQATTLFRHQALSFLPTGSLYLFSPLDGHVMHCDQLSTCFDGYWTYYACDVVYVRYCVIDM